MGPNKTKYCWRHKSLWLSLFAYWLTCTVGASFVKSHHESGWIILVMLVFVSICMITERGQWKLWQRIGFVPLAWIVEAILSPLAAFTIGMFVYASGQKHLVNRAVTLFASLPMVFLAMRRSILFVGLVDRPERSENQPMNNV